MEKEIMLSVIIIAYNEEKRIESCIKSIRKVLEDCQISYEIILVDSNSNDKTILLSQKSPIKIIKLTGFRTPSLGRYVGFLNSSGSKCLFIDGDMELILSPSEVLTSLNLLKEKIGGVQGYFNDFQSNGEKLIIHKVTQKSEVPYLPGSAFYSRAALIKENFNPFLNSNEERDLGYRLNEVGFSLLRLPIPMVNHYRRNMPSGMSEILRRYRSNFFHGNGQVIKSQKALYPLINHFLHMKYDLFFLSSLFLVLFSVIYKTSFLSIILGFHIILLMYYLFTYGSPNRYILKLFSSWGLIIGFLTYRKHQLEYDFIK